MLNSRVIIGLLAAGVVIALVTSIGTYTTFASQSNNNLERDGEIKSLLNEMKEMKGMMSKMNERMDAVMERMDMMMGDMMGPMDDIMPDGSMEDIMNQEPQDVIIKVESGHGKVQVGKEAEIVLLVLDKETQEPMAGVQVVIGIERGSSMSSMEMMGDMFDAEDKGSGEYIVRFTPDDEGLYTIHTMVMLPDRSMMDNHMDFSVIAE
jgi:hypothetical protein